MTFEQRRIALFIPECPWGEIDETAMGKGLGGRETALASLAIEWAKLGHEVFAFVPRKMPRVYRPIPAAIGTVHWIPMQSVITVAPILKLDMFVSWENVEVFRQLGGDANVGKRVIEMQVAHLRDGHDIWHHVHKVAVLSEWAKRFISPQLQETVRDNIVVLPNGIDVKRFENAGLIDHYSDEPDVGPHLIYSSSPDRGLHHLLNYWDDIQQTIVREYGNPPTLHICYGVESFLENNYWAHNEGAQRASIINKVLAKNDPSIVYHGKVSQGELAGIMMRCDAMAYPCDPMAPTETGCISIVEALAAGITVATTTADCLGEDFSNVTFQSQMPFKIDDYIVSLLDALNPEDYQACIEAGFGFAQTRSWTLIAKQWLDTFGLWQIDA